MVVPASVEDVQRVLIEAGRTRRRVTVRGGGHSFDAQGLSDDLAIDLSLRAAIGAIDPESRVITVEAGARWGAVLEAVAAAGCVPHSIVSTAEATVGGTVAAHCLSRFSSAFGKEGRQVRRLELVTVGGERVSCSATERAPLFRAAIGGFGYLGVITEVSLALRPLAGRYVETEVTKHDTIEALLADQLAASRQIRGGAGDRDAVFSLAFFADAGYRSMLLRSRYVASPGRRFAVFQPHHPLRLFVEWLIPFTRINQYLWNRTYRGLSNGDRFVDPLEDYLFFLDANSRAKRIARRLGFDLQVIQQTFFVPPDGTAEFLALVRRQLGDAGIAPTILDIVFIPAEPAGEAFVLSSAAELDGFAISIAFEDLRGNRATTVAGALRALSRHCRRLGGRIHLVKNIHADRDDLEAMYGDAFERFRAIKREYDPDATLRNGFFDRVFGAP